MLVPSDRHQCSRAKSVEPARKHLGEIVLATAVPRGLAPPFAGLLESADLVNREIGFPPSAEWERMHQPNENQFSQIRS